MSPGEKLWRGLWWPPFGALQHAEIGTSPALLMGMEGQKPGLSVQKGWMGVTSSRGGGSSGLCRLRYLRQHLADQGDCLQGAHLCGEGKEARELSSFLWGPAWGGIAASRWPGCSRALAGHVLTYASRILSHSGVNWVSYVRVQFPTT